MVTDESLERRVNELKSSGMDGVMYPFGPTMGDYFTRISRIIDVKSKFKYIIAIRPYTISAQYLSMICSSINRISKGALAINFLTGYVNKQEQSYGGILSEPNDSSPAIARSNYMLEYAKEFKKVSSNKFFISTTNETVFNNCAENGFAMIVPYVWYKANRFDIEDQSVVISIAPILSESSIDEKYQCENNGECRHPAEDTCMDIDFFTMKEFFEFLDNAEKRGVVGVMFQEADFVGKEYNNILPAITEYKRRKSEAKSR
ncbi:MAG: hypothetical protein O3A64_01525 [Proteobacteria bacterium]|nr:hypothetical protein [Pseudomonadota bacterium]